MRDLEVHVGVRGRGRGEVTVPVVYRIGRGGLGDRCGWGDPRTEVRRNGVQFGNMDAPLIRTGSIEIYTTGVFTDGKHGRDGKTVK
jgi:hypothetical protein